MSKGKGFSGMNRREFLKVGLAGTSAFVGGSVFAEAAQQYAASEPFVFPAPVYRTLGRTGLKITVVSFGAMLTPEPEVIAIALDHGVNYVDTARVYMRGKNEETVGKALQGRRNRVYLATKTKSVSKEDIIKDVETSLKELNTDHVDVIQLHGLTGTDRIFNSETKEALLKLKEQGKVRFFGVTTHTNQADVLNGLVDDKDRFFDTALVAYNFKSDKSITEAIARAAKANIGIIAMKTQGGGYTTKEMGLISPNQAAIKWALQNTNITAAIPGMRNMAELREDIAVMGMPFQYADQRILERYSAAIEPYYCTLCGQCEGTCPQGVEISTINRSLMYAEGYKSPDLARSTYREATVTASACLDCSDCVAQCARGLNISAKMAQARTMLG
jgi:predicted aldo/keto reductase-like oxidoreductase